MERDTPAKRGADQTCGPRASGAHPGEALGLRSAMSRADASTGAGSSRNATRIQCGASQSRRGPGPEGGPVHLLILHCKGKQSSLSAENVLNLGRAHLRGGPTPPLTRSWIRRCKCNRSLLFSRSGTGSDPVSSRQRSDADRRRNVHSPAQRCSRLQHTG